NERPSGPCGLPLPETNEVSPEEHCAPGDTSFIFTLLCIFGIVVLVFASFLPLLIVAEAGSLAKWLLIPIARHLVRNRRLHVLISGVCGVCMMLAQHLLVGRLG